VGLARKHSLPIPCVDLFIKYHALTSLDSLSFCEEPSFVVAVIRVYPAKLDSPVISLRVPIACTLSPKPRQGAINSGQC
jgi:hypothetical protein